MRSDFNKIRIVFVLLFILVLLMSCKSDENYIKFSSTMLGEKDYNKPVENIIFLSESENKSKFGSSIYLNPFIYDSSIIQTPIYFNLIEIIFYESEKSISNIEFINAQVLDKIGNNIGIFIKKEELINYWMTNQNIGKNFNKLKNRIDSLYLPSTPFQIKNGEKKQYYFVFKSIQKFDELEKFMIIVKLKYNGNLKLIKSEFKNINCNTIDE